MAGQRGGILIRCSTKREKQTSASKRRQPAPGEVHRARGFERGTRPMVPTKRGTVKDEPKLTTEQPPRSSNRRELEEEEPYSTNKPKTRAEAANPVGQSTHRGKGEEVRGGLVRPARGGDSLVGRSTTAARQG